MLLCASNTLAGTPLLLHQCGASYLKNENPHVGQHSVIWNLISEKRCSYCIYKYSVISVMYGCTNVEVQ
jgi:hypothetical protein